MNNKEQTPAAPDDFEGVDRSAELMRDRLHCPRCRAEYSAEELRNSPQIKCAFANTGVFNADNYSCGTMIKIRELAGQVSMYNEDEHACLLPNDAHSGSFVLVTWYKSRGHTQGLWLVDQNTISPMTYQQADDFLSSNGM